ncbi:hypothetical protein [Gemmatimonas sp.]|uniref:hypothetical protein n=1 Tax=Gemmatimonas sp. TaxID=1962908 RepID=UPI0022C487F6|nr:hypothetical protein [Gemmatimonas sp.]MCZ8205815.1 hypothetical protein [Gemmatimonas sp.]
MSNPARNTLITSVLLVAGARLEAQPAREPKAGQVQITVAHSLLPIQREAAQVVFRYVDGMANGAYPVDTISSNYRLSQRAFAQAITLGVQYAVTDHVRTSFSVRPYLNSFLSNRAKNGQVYGVQFDVGADYMLRFSDGVGLAVGSAVSRVIGGYGITSGGPRNKDYLMVDQTKLYDQDIGFHVVDQAWAVAPRIGLHVRAKHNSVLFANTGVQLAFARTSRINIAGTVKEGDEKWTSRTFSDPDLLLRVDDQRVEDGMSNQLPYRFSGMQLDLGAAFTFRSKKDRSGNAAQAK